MTEAVVEAAAEVAEGVRRHTGTAVVAALGGGVVGMALGLLACGLLALPVCLRVASGG